MFSESQRDSIARCFIRETDSELAQEYRLVRRILNVEGVTGFCLIDEFGEVEELVQDEICRRFCECVER